MESSQTFSGDSRERQKPSQLLNQPLCAHFASCFASTAFTLALGGSSSFIKKVNLPWNQLCPTETQQGLQTSGSEARGSCQGEENHRRSVSDGTAGVCHYSLMAEHCRCCCERKVLPQHNCCFSSDQNTEIKQSHAQVATKSIVKTYVFLLLIKHCSSQKCCINILGKG